MKFTKTRFSTACADGVVTLDGYAFDVGQRKLVAHKMRPDVQPADKDYHVSERTSGFPVVVATAPTRLAAAHKAQHAMAFIPDAKWAEAIAQAVLVRESMKPVPILKG